MLINLKKDYEKVVLAILLVLLAVSTVVALKSVDSPIINVDGGTKSPEIDNVPEIIDHAVTLKEFAGILTPHDVVYCRNSACNNLISKKYTSCPECSTEIYKTGKINTDINNNQIPDEVERSWGGRLADPLNHFRDLDGDGFRNVDEYRLKESAHDSESHPVYLLLASFAGVENKYLPIAFSKIEELEGVNGSKYYVTGRFRGKGGFYRSVGESVYGLQIIGVNRVQSTVSFLYKGQKIEIPLNTRRQVPGWPKYKVKFQDYVQVLSMGSEFYLKDEKYILKSLEEQDLIIHSKRSKEIMKLGKKPVIEPPVK